MNNGVQYPTDNKSSVLIIICFSLTMVGFAIIFSALMNSRALSKENNIYLRINACIVSVSPTIRTPEYVKSCYEKVQVNSGIRVDRFGDGK